MIGKWNPLRPWLPSVACPPLAIILLGIMSANAWPEDASEPAPTRPQLQGVGAGAPEAKAGLFRNKDGGLLLTNRPERYQHRQDYVEIHIKYEPIAVPQKYRDMGQASSYSGSNIAHLVTRYAGHYGLPENLVFAVIKAESNFDPYARSPKGACGLMQLMPGTAAEMGVTSIHDPAQNIAGGTQYLAKLLDLFNRDQRLALAAYNAGPNVVKRYGGVPPYAETQQYVRNVTRYAREFARDGVDATYLAKTYHGGRPPGAGRTTRAITPAKKYYTVHFHSGLTQPAETVADEGDYYRIRYRNRLDLIRKEHVKEIVAPA